MKDKFIIFLKDRIKFKEEQLEEYSKQLKNLKDNCPNLEFTIIVLREQIARLEGRINEDFFILDNYIKMKNKIKGVEDGN